MVINISHTSKHVINTDVLNIKRKKEKKKNTTPTPHCSDLHALVFHFMRVPAFSISHLISWWAQSKQLGVSVPLPCLLVEAVQLLMAAEGQQPLHSLVWGQIPQVEVGGGQCAARVITQPC